MTAPSPLYAERMQERAKTLGLLDGQDDPDAGNCGRCYAWTPNRVLDERGGLCPGCWHDVAVRGAIRWMAAWFGKPPAKRRRRRRR